MIARWRHTADLGVGALEVGHVAGENESSVGGGDDEGGEDHGGLEKGGGLG